MIRFLRVILFAFVFCLALMPEEFGIKSKALPDISVIRGLLLILTLALVAGLLAGRKIPATLKAALGHYRVPMMMLGLFFAWRIMTSLLSPGGAGTVATAIRDTLYFVVPFLVALICLRDRRDIHYLALMVGISASISALIGLVEYISGFRLYGMLTGPESAWHLFEVYRNGDFAGVLGTFPHPLAFGSYMVAGFYFGLLLYIDRKSPYRVHSVVIMVMCLIGVLISTSRGAQASLVAGMGFAGLLKMLAIYRRVQAGQRPVALMMIVAPTVFFIGIGLATVGYTLAQGGSEKQLGSSMMRVVQLEMSVVPILKRPVLGYGVGKSAETLGMKAQTVDDYYLTIALESGLVGVLLFIAMLASYMLYVSRAYLRYKQSILLILSMFLVAEATQLLVLSLKQALPLLYVGLAMVLVVIRRLEAENQMKWIEIENA
jgi:O-antigen ligase